MKTTFLDLQYDPCSTALIYQASTIDIGTTDNLEHRSQLLNKAEIALSQAYEVSGKKNKSRFHDTGHVLWLKGELARAAD